ncbi:inositol monophosphatase family protein [Rhodococcus kronopolitis]|uniref:Inositol monophosphatase family protein n=1 Tax=Rhodococcus kronopolitis TaxID=1460226 RepID=A0ABV9FV72_9NOCA
MSTRNKILAAALHLFGEQGYAGTPVARVEGEAGLSAGSGGLFRHFRTKQELLTEAVEYGLAQREDWTHLLDPGFSIVGRLDRLAPSGSRVDHVHLLCEMVLARLEDNRDLSRVLMRDNSIERSVLRKLRRDEYDVVVRVVTRGLAELAGDDADWSAPASVLVGAVSQFWLTSDLLDGEQPNPADTQRHLRATAELVAARIDSSAGSPDVLGVGTPGVDTDDLRLAFDASDLAAELAMVHFEAGVSATLKDDGTPVTEADRAVERLLRATLTGERPEDAFFGEEFGELGESDRIWILDPIDGTGLFGRCDPNWRIHIALEVQGIIQVAVVTSPALRRCWWATRGGGAFESSWPRVDGETRRLEVSATATLADAVLDAVDNASRARLPRGVAHAPGSPLPLVELVRGEIDAFLAERYFKWDHAPWVLIVEEAGGRFTDRTGGHASDQGGGLYSNANLHGQLLTSLQYPTH